MKLSGNLICRVLILVERLTQNLEAYLLHICFLIEASIDRVKLFISVCLCAMPIGADCKLGCLCVQQFWMREEMKGTKLKKEDFAIK